MASEKPTQLNKRLHFLYAHVFYFSYKVFKIYGLTCVWQQLRLVATSTSTVSSVIVFLKSKFNKFFRKVESSNDSDSDCYMKMYKEGNDIITFPKAEPNESSLNRTDMISTS